MMRLVELAERVGGELHGDGEIEIRGVAGIREAQEGDLTFLGHPRYEGFLGSTQASAVIMDERDIDVPMAVIRNPNPYLAFQRAMKILYGDLYLPPKGIHPTAVLGRNVKLGADVSIGPYVVIESGTRIGDRVIVRAGSYVGADTVIGADTQIYPNVVIRERVRIGHDCIIHAGAVIGDDGFGIAKDGVENHKIPQIGTVVIGNGVEIGSNTCVDRATIGETVIHDGARIDNLVQVGHNCELGRHAIVCAQVGMAGSSIIGDGATLGGQAGLAGHLRVGQRALIAARAGVISNVPDETRYSGYPARPHKEQLRGVAANRRVPELIKRVDELERRLRTLETEQEDGSAE